MFRSKLVYHQEMPAFIRSTKNCHQCHRPAVLLLLLIVLGSTMSASGCQTPSHQEETQTLSRASTSSSPRSIAETAKDYPEFIAAVEELRSTAPALVQVPQAKIEKVTAGELYSAGTSILVPATVFRLDQTPASPDDVLTLIFHEYGHVLFESNALVVSNTWKQLEHERIQVTRAMDRLEAIGDTISPEDQARLIMLRKQWHRVLRALELKPALHEFFADSFAVLRAGDLQVISKALGDPKKLDAVRIRDFSVGEYSEMATSLWEKSLQATAQPEISPLGIRNPYLFLAPSRAAMGAQWTTWSKWKDRSERLKLIFALTRELSLFFDEKALRLSSGEDLSPRQINQELCARLAKLL